jgi:rRNA-processing protein FCF1
VRYATKVRTAVVDTSTLISCARAGLLWLLDRCELELVTLDVVWAEAVTAGVAGGYADATAVQTALAGRSVTESPDATTADVAVLQSAMNIGVLVTNDLALGRRARNVGVAWLRTADLVILAVRVGGISRAEGEAAVTALRDARRITAELAEDYLEELR